MAELIDQEELRKALTYLDPKGYKDWIDVGLALHDGFGGSAEGEQVWDDWSKHADNYDSEKLPAKWESFGRGSGNGKAIHIESIFAKAMESGYEPPLKGKGRSKKSPEEVLSLFRAALTHSEVERELKIGRGLTQEVIDRFELGRYAQKVVFPVRDETGKIAGFKVHKGPHLKADGVIAKKGEGIRNTLYPSGKLDPIRPVYLAGGEPDVWRLAVEGAQAITGTAGEGAFKREWFPTLKGFDVYLVSDHDETGTKAMETQRRELKGLAGRLLSVAWSAELKPGYDVTNWLQAGNELIDLPMEEHTVQGCTLAHTKQVLHKWLQMSEDEDQVIDVVLGAMVANRFSGDPVWLFLVGPPGIIKTEVLRTLSEWREVFITSSLKPNALISGFTTADGKDPSLLPELNGKVLIVKDFTVILDMPREGRQEIFGQLRDAYDGEAARSFGSEAATRRFKSKFGVLAAVTPAIDRYYSVGQQLGERFLKIRISVADSLERIKKARSNSGREGNMRIETSRAMEGCLHAVEVRDEQDITIPEPIADRLDHLADCLATLRSMVARDGYTHEIEYRPEPEIGTRLVKQFVKLARGIAAVRGRQAVEEGEYSLIARIARDSLPTKRLELILSLFACFSEGFLTTAELGERLNMPTDSARRSLEDLWLLRIIERQGTGKHEWRMREGFRERLEFIRFFDC